MIDLSATLTLGMSAWGSALTPLLPPLPIQDPVEIFLILMTIVLVAPLVFERLRLPGIIGLILAGVIVGPHGIGLLARDNTIVLLGTVGLLERLLALAETLAHAAMTEVETTARVDDSIDKGILSRGGTRHRAGTR